MKLPETPAGMIFVKRDIFKQHAERDDSAERACRAKLRTEHTYGMPFSFPADCGILLLIESRSLGGDIYAG